MATKNYIQLIPAQQLATFNHQNQISNHEVVAQVYNQLIDQIDQFKIAIVNDFDHPLFYQQIQIKPIIAQLCDHYQQPFKITIFNYHNDQQPQIMLVDEQMVPQQPYQNFLMDLVLKIYQQHSQIKLKSTIIKDRWIIYDPSYPHRCLINLQQIDANYQSWITQLESAIKPLQGLIQNQIMNQATYLVANDQSYDNYWSNHQQVTIDQLSDYLTICYPENFIDYQILHHDRLEPTYQLNFQTKNLTINENDLKQLTSANALKQFQHRIEKILSKNPFIF